MSPRHKLGLRTGLALLLLPMTLAARSVASQPAPTAENAPGREDEELLGRIWDGVQKAQNQYTTGCGNITETRTSELLDRPLVLSGKFCAAGTTKFNMQYFEPTPLRVTFNQDYLSVSTGSDVTFTEVFKVGHHVRRTQGYFSRGKSIDNIEESFVVSVQESDDHYELKLVPRTKRFESRVNYIVVTLDKKSFLLFSLEVDGKSGVNSRFRIEMTELNRELNEDTFRVYQPR